MIFSNPLALLLLLTLPVFALIGWPRSPIRRQRDLLSLALRLVLVTLIVLSLAGAQITRAADRLSVVFLVDVSDSMDSAAQGAALDYVREAMETSSPDDQSALILFGADALVERPMLVGTELGPIGSTPTTLATDMAEAIRLGLALFPADAARRMVILSDGVATTGDTLEAVRLAAATGVQIDFVPFQRLQVPEVAVTNVDVPTRLNVDEPFEVNYTIESDSTTEANVTLLIAGATVARTQVDLRPGENNYFFRLPEGFPTTGFGDIRIQVEPVDAGADGFYQNNQLSAFTEITGPPRVLLVRQAGQQGADDTEHVLPALEGVGLIVDVIEPGDLPNGLAPLSGYSSVVMVNVPASDLSERRMTVLDTYVRDLGGGLVMIGGDQSYGVGGYFQTPLEETLPVEMQIRDQERLPALTLFFVVDTSGSMGAIGPSGFTNLDLAKEAIIRSIDLLNPVDRIGVVSFQADAAWIIDVTNIENPIELQTQVASLAPGGGTDILAGLNAVSATLPDDPSQFKHVILLTDGGANPSGIVELTQSNLANFDTTTSVVAIGDGFAPFLQDVANAGNGNFHFARDVASIPTIFTAETVLATRSYIVENEFFPRLTGNSPILNGISSMPALLGYVATTEKETAQVLLRSPDPDNDPILAQWQYGLGRAVAWTSDAAARWANNYVGWEQFPRLFSQMVRWTITEGVNSNLEVRIEQRGEQAVLVADARDSDGDFLNGLILDAAVVDPGLQAAGIELFQVAPGRYEAVFTPGNEGAYFVRVAGAGVEDSETESVAVAQTSGWVLTYSPEYLLPEDGTNLDLLNDMANLTEGESLAGRPEAVFDHNLVAQDAPLPIWPWLVLAAAVLLPVDIAVRRLIITRRDLEKARLWLFDTLGINIRERAADTSGRLDRLKDAKQRATQEVPGFSIDSSEDARAPQSLQDTVLPQDERQQPARTRPQPQSASGRTAASLASRRRAARDGDSGEAAPAQPGPAAVTVEKPAPPEPAPAPRRPAKRSGPTYQRREDEEQPARSSGGSTLASRLRRRREANRDDPDSED